MHYNEKSFKKAWVEEVLFKSDNKDLISLFTGEPRKETNSLAAKLGSKLLQDLQNKSMALQNELTTSQRLQ